jgi:hypothetical protein
METNVDQLFAETLDTLAATLVAFQVAQAGGDADHALLEAVRRFNNLRRSLASEPVSAAQGSPGINR